MATIKVSGLAAKNTLGGSEEILINDGGVSKKSTVAGITLAGEVTGAVTGVVIAANVVDEANLKVSNTPTNGYVLTAQSGNTGGLTWAQDSATDNTKLPLAGGTMTGNLVFADSVRARFGASNDLQIFHDASNSYIENTGTGDLIIQDSGGDVRIKGKSNEDSIVANNDGSVDLYYDNAKKFETTSTGIDVTGNVTVGDGSTSAPSISFSADTNTGFYRVGSDKIGTVLGGSLKTTLTGTGLGIGLSSPTSDLHLYKSTDHTRLSIQCAQNTGVHWQFQSRNNGEFWIRNETAGDNKLIINSSGNVGIGTTSPSELLDIEGSSPVLRIATTANGTPSTLEICGRASDGSPVENRVQIIGEAEGSTANSRMIFKVENASGVLEKMRINSSGNVGIGTTSPANILHVHQSDAASNSYVHITQADGGSASTDGLSIGIEDGGVNAVIRNRENGYLRMYTNNTERMRIDSSGKVLIGGTTNAYSAPMLLTVSDIGLDVTDGTKHLVSWASHGGSSHTGSAIGTRSNHDLALITNDVKRIIVTNSGKVGIGVAAPTEPLQVHGAIRSTNNASTTLADSGNFYYIPTADDGSNPRTVISGVGTSSVGAHVTFKTGTSSSNTEKVRITSAGNVGIRTTTPQTEMHVVTANASLVHIGGLPNANGNYQGISLGYAEANNTLYRKVAVVSRGINDGNARQDFNVLVDTAADTASAVVADVKFAISGTTGICQARNGLTFGSDTAAANALDDYEEGEYNVAITMGTSGSVTMNDSYKKGSYIKIGQMVTVCGFVIADSVSSPQGYIRFSLPFAVGSGSQESHISTGSCQLSNMNTTATLQVVPYVAPGQSYWLLGATNDNAASSYESDGAIAGNSRISFQVTYRTS